MKSYGICLCLTGLFHLPPCPPGSSVLLNARISLCQNNIHYIYMYVYVFYVFIFMWAYVYLGIMNICISHYYPFIHQPLGCFHILTDMNNAAVNISLQYPVYIYIFRSWIARTVIALFCIFGGTSMLFSTVAVPIYIPTNNAQWFLFSSSSPTPVTSCFFFDKRHSDRYEVILWFSFAFPWWWVTVICWPFQCLLLRNINLSPLPIF